MPAFLAERGKPLATHMARFGIQSWRATGGKKRPPLLNARTDTLRRGSFKTMLANHRCVIPAEGFYEWREENGKKQPYFFARRDGEAVVFGSSGITPTSRASDPVVCDPHRRAQRAGGALCDRMPVVLADVEPWLDLDTTLDDLRPLGTGSIRGPPGQSRGQQGLGEEHRRHRARCLKSRSAPAFQWRRPMPDPLGSRRTHGCIVTVLARGWGGRDSARDVASRSRVYARYVERADHSLRIAPLRLELARGRVIDTFAYNGTVPGPVLRLREGRQVGIDIRNDTDVDDIVLARSLPALEADGAMEEGSPMVERGGTQRRTFAAKPTGRGGTTATTWPGPI